MKRFISILLAVAMTISMVLPVFAARYTDTKGNDYEAAIEHLSGLNVINGYEDGSYKPEQVVTRAEMAKLMVTCLALNDGAELLKGESEFADVATNHWAIGFINVATQYGVIKGDGDGNFRPDDTVSYAETVTMALRALGYTATVEQKGQWPTNYINKANELDLFEDVENFKISDGARRGEVAQILWNMLRCPMWEVISENETNGLTSTANRTMMSVKFPKFTFRDALVFDDYEIKEDEKEDKIVVNLYFIGGYRLEDDDGDPSTPSISVPTYVGLEYAENDFYKLVPKTEYEVLYNDKGEIVTMVLEDEMYLAEGKNEDLNDKYENLSLNEDQGEYSYVLLDSKRATANCVDYVSLDIDDDYSWYVEEIKEYSKGKEFTFKDADYESERYDEDDVAETLVLINGERKTLKDIKVGDVVSFLRPDFAIVSRDSKVEGTVKKYVDETYGGYLTLGSTKYYVINEATALVEPDEDEPEAEEFDVDNVEDYKNAEAVAYLDFLGNVVRIEIAELVEDEEGTAGMYIISGAIGSALNKDDDLEYRVKLTGMDGTKKSYIVNEGVEVDPDIYAGSAHTIYKNGDTKINSVVWVHFNDDGEIIKVELVADFKYESDKFVIDTVENDVYFNENEYDSDTEAINDEEAYNVTELTTLDLDGNYLKGNNGSENVAYKVTSSTKYVKVIFDDDTATLKYDVKVETGRDALKGISGKAIVVYSTDFDKVDYVIVCEDTTTTDLMFGYVLSYEYDKVNKEYVVEIANDPDAKSGTEYVVDDSNSGTVGEFTKDTIALFVLTDKDEAMLKATIDDDAIVDANYVYEVDKADKRTFWISGDPSDILVDLDDESYSDDYEDDTVIVVNVTCDYDEDNHDYDASYHYGPFEIDSFEETTYEDMSVKKDNLIKLGFYDDVTVIFKLDNDAKGKYSKIF